jgi:hypothetical protein
MEANQRKLAGLVSGYSDQAEILRAAHLLRLTGGQPDVKDVGEIVILFVDAI